MSKQNPKPNPKSNPKPIQPIPQLVAKPMAICPRCGKTFPLEKPLKECPKCFLILAEEEDGELEWNEKMSEPLPTFLSQPLANDQIFARTLEWYYEHWVKPNKENPSHKMGKI